MKPLHIVEAALFSAGRPLAVEEIMEEGLGKKQVEEAVAELSRLYDGRDSVLEVKRAGAKWAMQVRRQAAEPAAKFAPMEIPRKVLKTLALIAYHQPVKQSDLKDMVGSRVYDHVPELKDRGLVKTRRDGQTKIITTTQAFPEYFGLEAATPDEIRAVMAKLVGLDPEKDRPKGLESFEQGPTEPDPGATHDPPSGETDAPPTPSEASAPSDHEAGGSDPPQTGRSHDEDPAMVARS